MSILLFKNYPPKDKMGAPTSDIKEGIASVWTPRAQEKSNILIDLF